MNTTNKTTKIPSTDLQVGDVFWFSGYWCTLTRFVDNGVYARFPYTPADRDTLMFHHTKLDTDWGRKCGPLMITAKRAQEAQAVRS